MKVKHWVMLLTCLALLASLIACGTDVLSDPDASVLQKDIQDYISDCMDPDAEISSFEIKGKKREWDVFSAACAVAYGSDRYTNDAVFSLGYTLEKGAWILSQCSVEINAQETADSIDVGGESVSWLLDEDGVLTISGTGNMVDYVCNMGEVDTPWWESRDSIQSVIIENGVTSVGASAFYSCKNVTSMTIPESVIQIGSKAFSFSGLETLFFEGDAPTVDNDAFLNASVTAFYPVSADGWTEDKLVNYGGSVAWMGLSEDEMTSLMTQNELIGGDCGPKLRWVLNEDGTLLIGGTGNMDDYDFEIEIEYDSVNLNVVGTAPWWDVRDSIQTVLLMNGVTSIGNYAFYGCENITRAEMPDSVTNIGYAAFEDCKKLTDIMLPRSVSEIVPTAVFAGCESLHSIHVSPENQSFLSVDGVLFNKNQTKLICFPEGKTAVSYSIPAGVTEIGRSAFSCCTGLTGVIIPESVNCIGASAFHECVKLESVTIPEGVTEIGDYVFEDCTSLGSVMIPDSVTRIGISAFSGCGLTSVTIPDSVTEIAYGSFYGCDQLESVVIPGSLTSMGENAFAFCDNLKSVTVMEGVTMLGESAFEWCVSLTSVTLPSSLTKISGYAFQKCRQLENITIPSSITTIYNYAFSDCDSLTSVVIPASVTLIGNGAFRDCDSLNSVIFEGDAPELKGDVFEDTLTTAYYSASCSGWTSDVMKSYGGLIYWCAQ